MANLTSSRGPHVRDLFVGSLQGDMVTFENKESKRIFSMASSKNKRAPPPPKLGQYRPKILQGEDADVPVRAREVTPTERPVSNHSRVNAIIIGDLLCKCAVLKLDKICNESAKAFLVSTAWLMCSFCFVIT